MLCNEIERRATTKIFVYGQSNNKEVTQRKQATLFVTASRWRNSFAHPIHTLYKNKVITILWLRTFEI